MTFQWPSWVHPLPLPFPFPELHNIYLSGCCCGQKWCCYCNTHFTALLTTEYWVTQPQTKLLRKQNLYSKVFATCGGCILGLLSFFVSFSFPTFRVEMWECIYNEDDWQMLFSHHSYTCLNPNIGVGFRATIYKHRSVSTSVQTSLHHKYVSCQSVSLPNASWLTGPDLHHLSQIEMSTPQLCELCQLQE